MMGCLAQIEVKEEAKTGKKEVPEITFKNLSPPYKGYAYLKGSKKYGFQFEATSFNLVMPGGWQPHSTWLMPGGWPSNLIQLG
jgi:hypothetical protein